MNKIRQFVALLRFQMAINPFILFMPLALGMPYFLPFITSSARIYHPPLESLLSNQNIWLVGLIGVLLLAPELIRPGASNEIWATGTEFLLTRAVDRYLVFRARSAFFYLLILTIPIAAYCSTLRNPSLQITEYDKSSHQKVLAQMPGSTPEKADRDGRSQTITIPNGNTLVEGWRLWWFMCAAIGAQVFVYLIYPLKYRKFIWWGTYLVAVFLPLLAVLRHAQEVGHLSTQERMFFAFVEHQPLFWSMAIAGLILAQLWCERRFSQLEQT
jgi:hypothetical protein